MPSEQETRKCGNCGADISGMHGLRKYCSDICQRCRQNSLKRTPPKKCASCDEIVQGRTWCKACTKTKGYGPKREGSDWMRWAAKGPQRMTWPKTRGTIGKTPDNDK
jgi:hypothetical protein